MPTTQGTLRALLAELSQREVRGSQVCKITMGPTTLMTIQQFSVVFSSVLDSATGTVNDDELHASWTITKDVRWGVLGDHHLIHGDGKVACSLVWETQSLRQRTVNGSLHGTLLFLQSEERLTHQTCHVWLEPMTFVGLDQFKLLFERYLDTSHAEYKDAGLLMVAFRESLISPPVGTTFGVTWEAHT